MVTGGLTSSHYLSTVFSSPCYTCFTVLTLWASSFSSCSMGSSPGVTRRPEKCVKVIVGCNAVSMTFKMSSQLNLQHLNLLYSRSVLLGESEPASLFEKGKILYIWGERWVFLTLQRQSHRHLLTFPPSGPPCLYLIWFHFCRPGWKLKRAVIPRFVCV